jgi:hypothetical protein
MSEQLSNDVREFIGKQIHSVAQLEILLTLRSDPKKSWTTEEITQRLYLQRDMTSQLLSEIVERGLAIRKENSFQYQPSSELDCDVVEQLAHLYHERRVAIIAEIFSKPKESLRAFSDAFRLRRNE